MSEEPAEEGEEMSRQAAEVILHGEVVLGRAWKYSYLSKEV